MNFSESDFTSKLEDDPQPQPHLKLEYPSLKFEIKQEEIFSRSPFENHGSLDLSGFDEKTISGIPIPLRGPRKNKTSPNADSKNIIKNYGKAFCGFASSKLAVPYILNIADGMDFKSFDIKKFMSQMKVKKEATNSMEHIRTLLVEEVDDTDEQKVFKRVFKEVSKVFLKYFSVNWIFHGKLKHKIVHLKYRFKMLRRIENPEYFTYLKTRK